MTVAEVAAEVERLRPWFYPWNLGNGILTPFTLPAHVAPIFETRKVMMAGVIEHHFANRINTITSVDIGCHEGYYSVALAQMGVKSILGIDAREDNLKRARFIAQILQLPIEYQAGTLESLTTTRRFDLTLCLGLLYHVENPVLCIRNLASITNELCLIETQVVDEVEGIAETGARDWRQPYRGILALIDESHEIAGGNRESGISSIAAYPSPNALTFMLRSAGFHHIEFIPPPDGGYEQHVRRKRVFCAAWR